MRPVLIDGFCCAGGATKGYQRAGFYVIGVDIKPQPNYCGDAFVQMDFLEFMAVLAFQGYVDIPSYGRLHLRDIAAWHGSPPCQKFSPMSSCRPGLADTYPDLVGETRDFFKWFGQPYVIENVPGSPVRPDLILCGQMLGLELYRHRLFESNVPMLQPPPPPLATHVGVKQCGWPHLIPASKAGHWTPGTVMSVSGHVSPMWKAREVMGDIGWMNRAELAESIPPQMAEYVGGFLMDVVMERIAA